MVEGFEHRSQIRVQLEMEHGLGRFPDAVEGAMYRVLQEGLANVLRHSGSNEVQITLGCRGAWLEVRIEDRDEAGVRPRAPRGAGERNRDRRVAQSSAGTGRISRYHIERNGNNFIGGGARGREPGWMRCEF